MLLQLDPLTLLSISALVVSILLYFTGVPICVQIYKQHSTKDITGFPFLMGFLLCAFWFRYGILKEDLTISTVNGFGGVLMFTYLLVYLFYTKPRRAFLLQLFSVYSLVLIMLLLVNIYRMASLKALGFAAMLFNILYFAAPLAGLKVVLASRNCSTLPLPMCVVNLVCASLWTAYSICIQDLFLGIPNGAGILLALVQLSLFLIFPMHPRATSAPSTSSADDDNSLCSSRENDVERQEQKY